MMEPRYFDTLNTVLVQQIQRELLFSIHFDVRADSYR
jgi:hypothetical protein